MGYISAREASKETGYTQQHISWLIREGRVKGRKFAQTWMVDKESLLAYVESAKNSGDDRYGPRR